MLWIVTTFYNPAKFRVRSENFARFVRALTVPLLVVEHASSRCFEARAGATIHVPVTGGDVLWQKERLLNVALEHLPSSCTRVAWMDCDLIIRDSGWSDRLNQLLDLRKLVQGFSNVRHLSSDGSVLFEQPSLVAAKESSAIIHDTLARALRRSPGNPAAGFFWAADKACLERIRFYDGCIVGGGDTAFASGVYDQGETAVRLHGMNVQQTTRYREWARAAYDEFQTNVGFLNLTIDHMWHGSMENRNSSGRHAELNRYDFDPYEDIAIDPGGAWRWNTDKIEMHRFVREYFRSRDEDQK